MNDSDFSQESFKHTFQSYMSNNSACNTKDLDAKHDSGTMDFSIVTRDIKKGDEITRNYKIDKWIAYLFHDIKDQNPTHNNKLNLSTEEQNVMIKRMIDAMKELGHNIERDA
jgi:hypothetical protein